MFSGLRTPVLLSVLSTTTLWKPLEAIATVDKW